MGHRSWRSRWKAWFLSTLLPLGVGACVGGDGSEAWTVTETDSAGVAIVQNHGTGSRDDAAWAVREDLALGGDASRPETLFGFVADLAVDDAGRLYVLDQHAQEVRVFEADGTSVGSVGGPGEGPGELSRFTGSLLIQGDTLMVADWGRGRIHRFLLDGSFLEAPLFPGAQGARSWWVSGADGGIYFRALTRFTDDAGRWSGQDGVFRVTGLRSEPDTVLQFSYPEADLGGPGNPVLPLVVNTPAWVALPDGSVAWTTLESGQVRIHGPAGRLRRVVRSEAWTPRAPMQPEAATLRSLMREKLRMLGGDPGAVDHLDVVIPEVLPTLTDLAVGPSGTLWVQRMGAVEDVHPMALNTPDPPRAWGGGLWDVLGPEGRYRGLVRLPSRMRVLRIRDDAVYGVRWSFLGEEQVVRLRIDRPAGADGDGA